MDNARLVDDRRCFACGPDNAEGMQLAFEYGEGSARAIFQPKRRFAGWTTILHGGILATLLDEAMAHAAIAAGVRAVTGRLEVRFRKAAPIDRPLITSGKIESRRGRLLNMSASVTGVDGTVYAQGQGQFLSDDGEKR